MRFFFGCILFICSLYLVVQGQDDFFNSSEWQGYKDLDLKDITAQYIEVNAPHYRVYWNVTESEIHLGIFVNFTLAFRFPANTGAWSAIGFSETGFMVSDTSLTTAFLFNGSMLEEWTAISQEGLDEDFTLGSRVSSKVLTECVNGTGAVCPSEMVGRIGCGSGAPIIHTDFSGQQTLDGNRYVHYWEVKRPYTGNSCHKAIPFNGNIFIIASFGPISETAQQVWPFSVLKHYAVNDETKPLIINPSNILFPSTGTPEITSTPTAPPTNPTTDPSTQSPDTTTTPTSPDSTPSTQPITSRVPTTRPGTSSNASLTTFSFLLISLIVFLTF